MTEPISRLIGPLAAPSQANARPIAQTLSAGQIIPFPQEFRPKLPTIVGNVDYLTLRCQRLEQIDAFWRAGGVEEDFVQRALQGWNPEAKTQVF